MQPKQRRKSSVRQNSASPTGAQEIKKDEWITFLAEFTRENRGAHARLEILGSDSSYQVPTEDRPFDGISSDVKDGERGVWIAFGSTSDDHLTHGIQGVTAIRLRSAAGAEGPALEVEARDGSRAVLELSSPEAYALPPAGKGAHS